MPARRTAALPIQRRRSSLDPSPRSTAAISKPAAATATMLTLAGSRAIAGASGARDLDDT
jgi:hypothetical protein